MFVFFFFLHEYTGLVRIPKNKLVSLIMSTFERNCRVLSGFGIENEECFAVAQTQGGRRVQEDSFSHFFSNKECMFAVFDGNGGDSVSKLCSLWLLSFIRNTLAWKDGDYIRALRDGFLHFDDFLHGFWDTCRPFPQIADVGFGRSGASAAVVVVANKKIFVAHAGDVSVAIVHANGLVQMLTESHSCERPDERERVCNAGGKIQDNFIDGVLRPTRGFANFDYKIPQPLPAPELPSQCVSPLATIYSAQPEIAVMDIHPNHWFLVIGTKQVWETWQKDNDATEESKSHESLPQASSAAPHLGRFLKHLRKVQTEACKHTAKKRLKGILSKKSPIFPIKEYHFLPGNLNMFSENISNRLSKKELETMTFSEIAAKGIVECGKTGDNTTCLLFQLNVHYDQQYYAAKRSNILDTLERDLQEAMQIPDTQCKQLRYREILAKFLETDMDLKLLCIENDTIRLNRSLYTAMLSPASSSCCVAKPVAASSCVPVAPLPRPVVQNVTQDYQKPNLPFVSLPLARQADQDGLAQNLSHHPRRQNTLSASHQSASSLLMLAAATALKGEMDLDIAKAGNEIEKKKVSPPASASEKSASSPTRRIGNKRILTEDEDEAEAGSEIDGENTIEDQKLKRARQVKKEWKLPSPVRTRSVTKLVQRYTADKPTSRVYKLRQAYSLAPEKKKRRINRN